MTGGLPIREQDGLVELASALSAGPLANADLAPTAAGQRTWNRWHIAALWIGMSVCIPTYMLAASMIAAGMTWWQSLLAILLGNVIVLVPLVINAHAGTKYGIPFPVYARAAFGPRGAHLPSMLRSVVACGWFGIQTWIGGLAIDAILAIVWPGWRELGGGRQFMGHGLPQYCGFLLFWVMNLYFVWAGTESIKWLETLSAPFLVVVGLALLWWAVGRVGGLGVILREADALRPATPTRAWWAVFVPWVTAMVGYWATLSLNIPDFTRYARSQRDQIVGQALGLPPTMTLYAFIGVAVTSATLIIFPGGKAIWDPVELLGRIGGPFTVLLSMVALNQSMNIFSMLGIVVLFGIGFGSVIPMRGTLGSLMFGTRSLGSVIGLLQGWTGSIEVLGRPAVAIDRQHPAINGPGGLARELLVDDGPEQIVIGAYLVPRFHGEPADPLDQTTQWRVGDRELVQDRRDVEVAQGDHGPLLSIFCVRVRSFIGWLHALALTLGGPGIFVVAFLDSSFLSLPQINDLLVVVMVTEHKDRMLYYAGMATLGSVAGCYAIYYLAQRGGEAFVQKRLKPGHVQRALAAYKRNGLLALMIPALLPPPAPFKLFVLAAGVARVRPLQFVIALTVARGARYLAFGVLAIYYGDAALELMRTHGRIVALVVVGLLIAGVATIWLLRRRARRA